MDQALTNKKFIQQIDDVIETLGGTPVDLELTEDREDDMVSNGVFVDKMDEVIEALGGTPSELIVGDDKADDMVSDNIFQLKMEDVVKNMPGGGGGGSSDFSTASITVVNGADVGGNGAFLGASSDYADLGATTTSFLPYDIEPRVGTVILYKGKAIVWFDHFPSSVSGGITVYNAELSEYVVTGDCTVIFE